MSGVSSEHGLEGKTLVDRFHSRRRDFYFSPMRGLKRVRRFQSDAESNRSMRPIGKTGTTRWINPSPPRMV